MDGLYTGDSFFTLGLGGRIGLVMVSGLIVLVAALVARVLFARLGHPLARLAAGFLVFWGFVWLAPQLHYLYYMTIFTGLPLQWVIGWPPGIDHVLALLAFAAKPTLSHHSQGLLGWAFMTAGLVWHWLPRLPRPRSPRSRP